MDAGGDAARPRVAPARRPTPGGHNGGPVPSIVPLPPDVRSPFEVYVNGVRQEAGVDYEVVDRSLVFERVLKKEGKLGFWRWLSMALSIAGSYGRNDSVDVRYTLAGTRQIAVGLDIEVPNLAGDEDRPDHR